MNNIKAIIFDIGGVVTFTDFDQLHINFGKRIGVSPEFIAAYHKNNWEAHLLGDISLKKFFEDMQPSDKPPIADMQSQWLEEAVALRKINTELLEIIKKLRKQYKVGVLTNLTPSRLLLDNHSGLYNYFDFAVLSHKERLKKPDPEFYKLALEKADVSPSEAVLVDDLERNIIAAEALGIKTVLYKDNQNLLEQLGKLGVEV